VKVGLIAPKNLLEYTRFGDIHFILPQNATEFFVNENKYKMVDNGTYETGTPLDMDELVGLAQQMGANEIVLPDVINDISSTMEFVGKYAKHPKYGLKFAAVPQGFNAESFIACYLEFAKIPELDVLCFPIWLEKQLHLRPQVVNYLHSKGWLAKNKEHHLIGCDLLAELLCYPKGLIRSVDTSMPFSAALAGKYIDVFRQHEGKRCNFEYTKLTAPYLDVLRWNINKLLEVAHSV